MFLLFTWNSLVLWLLFFCLVVCCWVGGFFHPFSAGWESCLSSFHCVNIMLMPQKGRRDEALLPATVTISVHEKKLEKEVICCISQELKTCLCLCSLSSLLLQLISNYIWKLGYVFAEFLKYRSSQCACLVQRCILACHNYITGQSLNADNQNGYLFFGNG